MVPHDPEQLACPLSDPDAPDAEDDTRSVKSAITVLTHRTGDSIIGESEADLEEGEEGEVKEKRSTRKPRDITPTEQLLKLKWAGRNDAEHVGNIGLLFGNWGKRPKSLKMRNHLDTVLKNQLAMVIGLAEC